MTIHEERQEGFPVTKEKHNDKAMVPYTSLLSALQAAFGSDTAIIGQKQVYGGDINDAYALVLSDGQKIFMKTNAVNNYRFFSTEERGLSALRATGAIGVPKLLGTGIDKERGFSFLLLEFLESTAPIKTYWEEFGRQLARMHRADCSAFGNTYGFPEDNFIGATVQKNTPKTSWIDFFRDCRLKLQITMAKQYFDVGLRKKLDYLLTHLEDYIQEPAFPSVLHGDLWGGNVICGRDGKAWLIDPAAYVGDFETDLAMTELFGRFPSAFYAAYAEINPIDSGYRERKKIYQLYHILNHLNLFGRSYLGSVAALVEEIGFVS